MAKTKIEKLKKRLKRARKIIKVGLKTIKDRDGKIAQLSSILDQQGKPGIQVAKRP